MKCTHCGKEISPTSRFCTYCGNKVSASSAEIKTKKMRCNACGGVLSIHEDKQVLFCPYCGSKELINESGAYTFKRKESSADTFRHEESSADTSRRNENRTYSNKKRMYRKAESARMVREDKKSHRIKGKAPLLIILFVVIGLVLFVVLSRFKRMQTALPSEKSSGSTVSNNWKSDEKLDAFENELEEEINYSKPKELAIKYRVLENGDAEIVGYSGDGTHLTLDRKIDGHTVTRIADSAFKDCKTLKDITCWADLEEIGAYAFSGCTALTSISIPNSTKTVGAHAYEGCTGATHLSIWNSEIIEPYAFASCTGLKSISIPTDTKTVGEHAFDGCTGATHLSIWDAETIKPYAFANCTRLKRVSIPSETKTVCGHAFDGCKNLTDVSVWGEDTVFEKDAFSNCPKLAPRPERVDYMLEFESYTN